MLNNLLILQIHTADITKLSRPVVEQLTLHNFKLVHCEKLLFSTSILLHLIEYQSASTHGQ